jgi:pimeloyl-ACP methyl ester carboxylesterase
MARTMELVPNGKRIYDAATPGYIAAAVIVDVTPMNPTLSYPPVLDVVRNDVDSMARLDLSKLKSHSDASEWLEHFGITDTQKRNFLLTNLERDPQTQSVRWRCNLQVLNRDFEDMLTRYDPEMMLENRCDMPILFVFGKRSPYNTPEARSQIKTYFSNVVDEVEIEDAGHFVHYEKMDQFVEAVAPFLYEHMGP